MKKLIIATLALLNSAFAQTNCRYNPLFSSSDTLSIGDTAWIGAINVEYGGGGYDTVQLQIMGNSYLPVLHKYKCEDLMYMPTMTYGGTQYVVKLNITIPNDAKLGDNNFYMSGFTKYVYIKPSLMGIQTHSIKDELQSIEYYDLLENKINEPKDLTIEIRTYKNGYKEIRKIISLI